MTFRTDNIIDSIEALRQRGTQFLDIPDTYYNELKRRLLESKVEVKEDLNKLQKLKILVDYDDEGYLLQVFNNSSYFSLNSFKPFYIFRYFPSPFRTVPLSFWK